jgi:PAS domain S-box-containing protein
MTVAALVQLLQYAVAAGFIFLGLASLGAWARHHERSRGWLAMALGLLGLTSLLGLLPRQLPVLPQVSLVAFMASAYALVRFRACFLPLSRGRLRVVAAVVVVSTLLVLVEPLPSGATPHYTAPELAIVGLLVVVWSGCVGEPAVRFWLASRRRPAVQRARLRALSGGYGGIVGILLFAVAARSSSAGVVIATQVVALAIVPLLYAGFAPPRWLRLLWREHEEDLYRKATQDLLVFTADPGKLMERALEWSTRLVGADAGVIASRQGEVLAARNLAAADADALARRLRGGTAPGPGGSLPEARLLVVPIVAEPEGATLIVVAGPFTDLFGSDEVAGLQRYAALLALAMSGVLLYQGLLQNISEMGEGLVFSDDGGVTYANEEFARMTGYTHEELLSLSSATELVEPEDRERMAARRRDVVAGGAGAVHTETQLITRDGRRIHVDCVFRRRMVEGVPGTIAIVRDVTERKRAEAAQVSAEQAIRTLNQDLELRVAERTAEMEAFVYTVSHDLRAPLRAIDGFVGALVEDYRAELPAGAREFLDDVAANARQMAGLIEDLLAFSRLNRVLPKRQQVDPGKIASQVMEQLKPALAGRQVDVAIDDLPACNADPALLAQVYTNLLSNALKFSRRRDRAEIHLGYRRDAAGTVYVVEDNGVGFDPAYMDKLFGVFQRLHGGGEYEGTGVGLAIVQRIVERHGGTVWAESLPDRGATFFFRLKEVERHDGK